MADGPAVTVVGLADDRLDLLAPEARCALEQADVVVGSRHHLWLFLSWVSALPPRAGGEARDTMEIGTETETVQAIRRWAVEGGRRVCVLAEGDPGFFGIVRPLLQGLDRSLLRVLPAASALSVAFARLGLPWEDALVVSAARRPLADVVNAVRTARKAAVLSCPAIPPEILGAALQRAGIALDLVAVCSQLGSAAESVVELPLAQLAAGRFDPESVVVLVGPGGLPLVGWSPGEGQLAWGSPDPALDEAEVAGRPDVRSVVLQQLALPARGVLWDLSGATDSIAVACARSRPGLTVLAVAPDKGAAARLTEESTAKMAAVHVVSGHLPAALETLPDPDRAYVADDLEALDIVRSRLRPGGRVVARLSSLELAVAAADRLGSLVQLQVSPAERSAGGWRLSTSEPAFVAWGPG